MDEAHYRNLPGLNNSQYKVGQDHVYLSPQLQPGLVLILRDQQGRDLHTSMSISKDFTFDLK